MIFYNSNEPNHEIKLNQLCYVDSVQRLPTTSTNTELDKE